MGQNNKSNSKTIKPVNKNMLDFKNDILKIENIGDHLQHLVKLPGYDDEKDDLMQGVDFAMQRGLDSMNEENLTIFFNDDVDGDEGGKEKKSRI